MVCVHVPLLLKRNIGVYLESSEAHAVMLPFFFFSLLWFCNYIMGIIFMNSFLYRRNLFEIYIMYSYLYRCDV
jgi:hypothetical protein